MSTSCPPGCRKKPHGNKGRKPTLNQLQSLEAGRIKLATSILRPQKSDLSDVERELQNLYFYVDKLYQNPTAGAIRLIEKQKLKLNSLVKAQTSVPSLPSAPRTPQQPAPRTPQQPAPRTPQQPAPTLILTGIPEVDKELRSLQFYIERLNKDPSNVALKGIIIKQQHRVEAAATAAGITL